MIPLRDNVPSRSTPIVNYVVIAACASVFYLQLSERPEQAEASLVERFGMIPARLTRPDEPVQIPDVTREQTRFGVRQRIVERPASPPAVPPWLTLITSMFLHGGWMHILGNMWFLLQFFEGTLSITAAQTGSVAWWAHIGGFVAGFASAWLLKKWEWLRGPVDQRLPGTDHVSHHRMQWRRRDR